MTVLAPNRKVSTSSDKTASMMPTELRYASSASASPGAFIQVVSRTPTDEEKRWAHHSPFETECINDPLHTVHHPVLFPRDSFAAFDLWTLRTVKDEEGKEWHADKLRTTEEHGAKLGVLAFSSMSSMKEPD